MNFSILTLYPATMTEIRSLLSSIDFNNVSIASLPKSFSEFEARV